MSLLRIFNYIAMSHTYIQCTFAEILQQTKLHERIDYK